MQEAEYKTKKKQSEENETTAIKKKKKANHLNKVEKKATPLPKYTRRM